MKDIKYKFNYILAFGKKKGCFFFYFLASSITLKVIEMEKSFSLSEAHHLKNEPFRFLKFEEVQHHTSVSKTRWYQLISEGEAPEPIKLGRASVWDSRAIYQWQLQQIESKGGDE